MLFLNASFSGTPIGASSSSNDGSYYYISLPPGVDEDVAVGVPVRVGCMRRFSQYFNVSFDDVSLCWVMHHPVPLNMPFISFYAPFFVADDAHEKRHFFARHFLLHCV